MLKSRYEIPGDHVCLGGALSVCVTQCSNSLWVWLAENSVVACSVCVTQCSNSR